MTRSRQRKEDLEESVGSGDRATVSISAILVIIFDGAVVRRHLASSRMI